MNDPKYIPGRVSIIIPTYNYAPYIRDCIKSVFNQNYDDIEIIVVDDGSSDNTKKEISSFKRHITYIYQNNQGLSAARNTGIRYCTGEYIQFLDSDDLLGLNSIKQKVDFFVKHPEAKIIVGPSKHFIKINSKGFPKTKGAWHILKTDLDVHLCYYNIAPPHAFLCRREVIARTGFFNTELKACEDYDYWLRANVINGYTPNYCANSMVYYRQHAESMSKNIKNQLIHDIRLQKKLHTNLFINGNYSSSNELASKLAFVAGLAYTIVKLFKNNVHMELIPELDDLLNTAIKDIFNRHSERLLKLDITSRMYLFILLNALSTKKVQPVTEKYLDLVLQSVGISCFKSLFSNLILMLTIRDNRWGEKLRIIKHSSYWYMNSIFNSLGIR